MACGIMGMALIFENNRVQLPNGGWVWAVEGAVPNLSGGATNMEVFVGKNAGGLDGFGGGINIIASGPTGGAELTTITCDQNGCSKMSLP